MKRIFGVIACILCTSAVAQTVAPGPYYAAPSWDQTIPGSTRFIVLSNFANAAVLDRETGLVWERTPSTDVVNWVFAQNHCESLSTGNRMGWRLPTAEELRTLADPTAGNITSHQPFLPTGHPFSIRSGDFTVTIAYWSAPLSTRDISFGTQTIGIAFDFGTLSRVAGDPDSHLTGNSLAWCVRGGQGATAIH